MTARPKPRPLPPLRCSECGDGIMVERFNRKTGTPFLGCDAYPKCSNTSEIPAYVHQLRAGAEQLPGFE